MNLLFQLLAFFLFIFSCLYLPGKLLAGKLKLELKSFDDIFFPFGFGLMVFTLLAYIFSWLKLEVLILPSILLLDFYFIRGNKWLPGKLEKRHSLALSLVFLLSLVFSLSMLINGQFGDKLIYRHDDLWHLSLINELKVNFPPDNPSVAGIPLRGYHFFYNLILAKVSNIFLISPFSLHFRFLTRQSFLPSVYL